MGLAVASVPMGCGQRGEQGAQPAGSARLNTGQPPRAAPGKVVVRTALGLVMSEPGRAQCLPGERLIGGGCGGDCRSVKWSAPAAYGREDSEGAAWECGCGSVRAGGEGVTVFALSQRTLKSSTADTAVVGFNVKGSVRGSGEAEMFGVKVKTEGVSLDNASKDGELQLKRVDGAWKITCS